MPQVPTSEITLKSASRQKVIHLMLNNLSRETRKHPLLSLKTLIQIFYPNGLITPNRAHPLMAQAPLLRLIGSLLF